MRARVVAFAFATLLVSAPALAQPAQLSAGDQRAEALLNEGVDLYKERAWEPALAKFLESQRLHPTRSATRNAAYCLVKLGRLGEALDLYEALLRDFTSLPADLEAEVRAEIDRLRPLTGGIEVEEAEPGASIKIDGVERGPAGSAPALLRVAAGNRFLRVSKDEFDPFEARVEVRSGETVLVVAHLHPVIKGTARAHFEKGVALLDQGQYAAALDELLEARRLYPTSSVVFDAALCAKKTGRDVLALELYESLLRDFRGIPADRKADVQREIVELEGRLYTVEVSGAEPGAMVVVDNLYFIDFPLLLPLRLTPGHHTIHVVKEGFAPFVREVDAVAGQGIRIEARLSPHSTAPGAGLAADHRTSTTKGPAAAHRFTLELEGALLAGPTFDPDPGNCAVASCSASPGLGGMALARGGYDLGSLGFGLAAGYLRAASLVRDHAATFSGGGPSVVVTDALGFQGGVIGAWVGYSNRSRYRTRLRFGAGGVFGAASDDRSAGPIPPPGVSAQASFVYLDPEVRFGIRFQDRLELSVGVEAMVLFDASRPRWDGTLEVHTGAGVTGRFAADPLLPSVLFLVAPSLGVRYEL